MTLEHTLPVAAVLLIFAERMREVFTKRQTVPGKTRETTTFNLFMLCGVLGSTEKINFTRDDTNLTVNLPGHRDGNYAVALKITPKK